MIEQHGTGRNSFSTNSNYWDCYCQKNYIHTKKNGNCCPKCHTFKDTDGCPDSRVNEIKNQYKVSNDKFLTFV